MRRGAMAALAAGAVATHAAALASDTINYTYDALGRVTDVAITGGRNDGSTAATRYDPAGNRSSYSHSGATADQAASSQSSSSGEIITGLDEEGAAEEAPAAAIVEPPPPGGMPDESEPVVEIGSPQGVSGASGGDR